MNVLLNAYHIPFIRDQLTKGMDRFTEPLREEFGLAMDQHMNLNTGILVQPPISISAWTILNLTFK